jgi:ATP-dependent DNA ligase
LPGGHWLDLLVGYQPYRAVTLCAFDLLEVDRIDLRGKPIEVRKNKLPGLLARAEQTGDDG